MDVSTVSPSGTWCRISGASEHDSHSLRMRPGRRLLLGGFSMQFLHTLMPHLRQGATRSRAHLDVLPLNPSDDWNAGEGAYMETGNAGPPLPRLS